MMFLPKSYNFSEINPENQDIDASFQTSDDGLECEKEFSDLNAEDSLLRIISILTDRERTIFLCELIKDDGYKIDYLSIARAMHISRSLYMMLLKGVRSKAKLLLTGRTK